VTAARARQRGGIDRLITATLRFESGVEGHIVSSIWSRHLLSAVLEVTGSDGRMRVSWPYHPHLRGRISIRARHGSRTETPERRSTYAYQLEAFRDARTTGVGPAEAVAQMRTLDAIYRAAGMSPRP
jgi:predicted dehydrogenase